MPVTDRREPAVYVTIEDASYAAPTLETGRTVFGVILCDRGPHNRIIEKNSKESYHSLFGKPDFRRCSQTMYQLDKAFDYTGKVLMIRVTPEDSYLGNTVLKIPSGTTVAPVGEDFLFTTDDINVVPQTQAGYDSFNIGDWIYADGDTNLEAAQIVNKTDTLGTYNYVLDRKYLGANGLAAAANKYIPFITEAQSNVQVLEDMPILESDSVYNFHAYGAGSFYNNIKIKGVRNVEMEKMWTDDDGNVLHKYVFMDIAVYEIKDNGNEKLLEGPWTVSLMPRTEEGTVIRDLNSGRTLYIEDVINDNSEFVVCKGGPAVEELITGNLAEDKRLQVTLQLSQSGPIGVTNIAQGGIVLENGTDGTGLYDSSGNIAFSDELLGRVKLAYMGSLESTDGSIEQLPECVYPWYTPDYIVSGGFPAHIQDGARYLASYRQDCIHLADTGANYSKYEDELTARLENVPWNDWTSALYAQYRRVFDPYTGQWVHMSPVYHAIERHLYCDGVYFIGEPVANIEKGAISETMTLSYRANHTERGDLLDAELNPVIVEPQGKYLLTQFTTYKRLSVLKRLHVAKFTAYIRKVIPTLLKDILQRKATQYWINQANFRVTDFLNQFVENSSLERYSILKSFNVGVEFDDVRSELNVYCDITPIRAIERINVYIIVH